MSASFASNDFILEAFDRELWCPVLQALVHISDLAALRAILGKAGDDDPDLQHMYSIDDQELAALVTKFSVSFPIDELKAREIDINLFRARSSEAPYLIHTRYELPLLLEGRKKLARMSHGYPPPTFDGEHRFDRWVVQGLLHREEVSEPFDPPGQQYQGYQGHRTVYYTPKGEEWRIPASKLVWDAAARSGGWNEYFERLEGMLYGYEDWQNDWWINAGMKGGGFGGLRLCCAVTASGLTWIETAGFRALPPASKSSLAIAIYDHDAEDDLRAFMLEEPDSVALVRFNVLGRDAKPLLGDFQQSEPWHIPHERIPELNRVLRGPIEIIARREQIL